MDWLHLELVLPQEQWVRSVEVRHLLQQEVQLVVQEGSWRVRQVVLPVRHFHLLY